MYLQKITFDNEKLNGYRKKKDDIYTLHQKIWRIASQSEHQKRDFLYRVEYDAYRNIKFIYLLAPYKIKQQKNYKIAISPKFEPQVKTGESLYFKLRANPIVRKRENGRAKDCDIIMNAKHQFKRKGRSYLDLFSMDELIHSTGLEWIKRKGELHGFSVQKFDVKVDNYQEYKIQSASKRRFLLRTLDFEGKLTITNINRFKTMLFWGIGRSKAFGCGLMLVRRI